MRQALISYNMNKMSALGLAVAAISACETTAPLDSAQTMDSEQCKKDLAAVQKLTKDALEALKRGSCPSANDFLGAGRETMGGAHYMCNPDGTDPDYFTTLTDLREAQDAVEEECFKE